MQNKEVILLNKPFLGDWLDDGNNIGHEIIDFLSTDTGEIYIYNNPYGQCPNKKIGVNEGADKYNAKYLVLTGKENAKEKSFEILYVIELEELLHRESHIRHKDSNKRNKKEEIKLKESQEKIKKIIRERNICYNGKLLYDIYKNDETLYVTFKAFKIYRAEIPILIKMSEYNFQRNKGCLYCDIYESDYNKLKEIIESGIKDDRVLKEFIPPKLDSNTIKSISESKTFIDLIMQENNEQVFTNILYDLLKHSDLFTSFCEKFKKDTQFFDINEKFVISREANRVVGRMDICAESSKQRVVIENKINSGLNGLKPKDKETQLTTYYEWAKEGKTIDPLCFVIVPNYRKNELLYEIDKKDPNMHQIYNVITYKEIADFIENEYKHNKFLDYDYKRLIPDIINAFLNLSKMTKEELYAYKFIMATLN